MSVTLVGLWDRPADEAAFEEHYHSVHLPLARKLPGLTNAETYKTVGDGPYYRVVVLHFESIEALGAAMGTPEGAAVMADTEKLGTITTFVTQSD